MPSFSPTSFVRPFAACTLLAAVATSLSLPSPALAVWTQPFVLDFEGLDHREGIGDFYNGGPAGNGENFGYDFGVTFSDNSLALTDADAGGKGGNFGGEPTPDNVLFFGSGPAAIMNVADGFKNGLSLFYSAVAVPGKVNIYDDLNGEGTLLKTFELPTTPLNGAPDPTGQFSPFVPTGSSFEGIGRSVVFEGAESRIGFDNITIGAAEPLPGFTFDHRFIRPPEPVKSVPETSAVWALFALAGGAAGVRRLRAQR